MKKKKEQKNANADANAEPKRNLRRKWMEQDGSGQNGPNRTEMD